MKNTRKTMHVTARHEKGKTKREKGKTKREKGKGMQDKRGMSGGRFLGQGSYGCVVEPALECPGSMSNKRDADKRVSKIILRPNQDLKTELLISKRLREIDPKQDYFITFIESCRIIDVPRNRNNVVKARITGNNSSDFTPLEKKPLAPEHCPIDMSKKPINLIMSNAGYDLFDIVNFAYKFNRNPKPATTIPETDKPRYMIMEELKANFTVYFRHLLEGLLKMHQARIAARDIKLENMTINLATNEGLGMGLGAGLGAGNGVGNPKCNIRYIDFGLSEDLTPEYCSHYSNVSLQGTYDYVSPELFIAFNVINYRDYPDITILKQINTDIRDNVIHFHNKINRGFGKLKDIVLDLYNKMKEDVKNKPVMLEKYFGSTTGDIGPLNGYLQKGDVYALGATVFEIFQLSNMKLGGNEAKKEVLLRDLIDKMMEFNPDKRFNAQQCLEHEYFNRI